MNKETYQNNAEVKSCVDKIWKHIVKNTTFTNDVCRIENGIAVLVTQGKPRIYGLSKLPDGNYNQQDLKLIISDGESSYDFDFIPAIGDYIIITNNDSRISN